MPTGSRKSVADMPDDSGTFQPLDDSDRRLHGAPAIIACGYSTGDQEQLLALLQSQQLTHLPLCWAGPAAATLTLRDLVAAAKTSRDPEPENRTGIPRALIMSGLRTRELHRLMDGYRRAKLPYQLWATVTPLSEAWPLKQLLMELVGERAAIKDAMQQAKSTAGD